MVEWRMDNLVKKKKRTSIQRMHGFLFNYALLIVLEIFECGDTVHRRRRSGRRRTCSDAICSGSDMCRQDAARLARQTEGDGSSWLMLVAPHQDPAVKQSCHFAIGSSCSLQGRSHGAHGSRRQQGAGLAWG